SVGRNFLPLAAEGFGDGQIRVPDGLGGVGALLRNALVQTGDGGTVRAVDLELNQFVAVDPNSPGGVDLADDLVAARRFEFEDAIGSVVSGGLVFLAGLVPACGDVGGGLGVDALDLADNAFEHVVPVAEHVRGHSAAIFLAVVPGRTLCSLDVAFEDPV